MQRYVYLVCGFNGFNQFTNLVHEKKNACQSAAALADLNRDKKHNDNEGELFFVNPVELQWHEYLFYSWSSVYVSGGDRDDNRQYGFSEDSKNVSKGCHFISSEKEVLQQPWIRLEYSDCPRGFGFHCIDQIRWNIKNDFYLMGDKGVFKAGEITQR